MSVHLCRIGHAMRSARTNCSLAVEFSLNRENILLQNERITQLYIIQSEQDPFLWFGVLFVDSGIYMGAVVRFSMLIPDTYPDSPCPKITFDPIPYHPLVDPDTGELDTKNAFPDWNSNTHKLHQLLLFVKRVICQAEMYIKQIRDLIGQSQIVNAASSEAASVYCDSNSGLDRKETNLTTLTEETKETQVIEQSSQSTAAQSFDQTLIDLFHNFDKTFNCIRIYEEYPSEFQKRVDEFKQKCCHQLFDRPRSCGDDRNALVFSSWDPNLHDNIRNCVLAGRFAPTSLFASYHKETESVSFVPGSEPS